jgi:hypothetical protein
VTSESREFHSPFYWLSSHPVMVAYPVSTRLNIPKNNNADLIAPADSAAQLSSSL